MDPMQALIEARLLLSASGTRDAAADRLAAYFQWRLAGGFAPHGVADAEAVELLRQLGVIADILSEAL